MIKVVLFLLPVLYLISEQKGRVYVQLSVWFMTIQVSVFPTTIPVEVRWNFALFVLP